MLREIEIRTHTGGKNEKRITAQREHRHACCMQRETPRHRNAQISRLDIEWGAAVRDKAA